MSIKSLTVTRGQVAELLGISEGTFSKRKSSLESFGFPRKLPGMNAYSRPAVVDWIRTNGGTYQPGGTIEPVKLEAIVDARQALEQQYSSEPQKAVA